MIHSTPIDISLSSGKKAYFASDFHLGRKNKKDADREKIIVDWMEYIKKDVSYLFLLGDIFDFWFEYKTVIPKGFIRFQAKLVDLIDSGVEIIFFTGNHDMWMFDYFTNELNIKVFREPKVFIINNKKIIAGHGDGFGPGDYKYKILKKIFANRLCQWLFACLHPSIGMKMAEIWLDKRWKKYVAKTNKFRGNKEHIWQWTKQIEEITHHDYYIFGHRHLLLDLPVGEKSRYINLGEWINQSNYAVFDGENIQLLHFPS